MRTVKMYLIHLLLLTLPYFVKAEDDSDQRYIDLLPEAEKQAFLDQVARRLINEVKRKKSPLNLSGEVSNGELNEHGELVKRIIEEESGNVRRQRNVEEGNDEATKLTVRGLYKPDTEKSTHIDLTLRSGQRLSRNNNETEISIGDEARGYEIPVETVYDKDSSNDNVTSAVEKAILTRRLTSGEESEGLDIQVRGLRRYAKQTRAHTKIGYYDPDDETTEKVLTEDDSSDESDSHPPNFTARMYDNDDGVPNDKVSSEVDENTEIVKTTIKTKTTRKSVSTEKTTLKKTLSSSVVTTSIPTSTSPTSTNPTSTSPTSTTKSDKINLQNKTEPKNFLRYNQYEDIQSSPNDFENSSDELPSTTYSTKNDVNYDITESIHVFDDTTGKDEKLTSNSTDKDVILTTTELHPITDSTTYKVDENVTESIHFFDETTDTTYIPSTLAEDVSPVTAIPYLVDKKVIERSSNRSENLNNNDSIIVTNDFNKTYNNKLTSNGADEDVVVTTTTSATTESSQLQPITVHPGLTSTVSTKVKALVQIMKNKGSDTTDRNNVSTTKEVQTFNNLVKALRQGLQFQHEEGDGDNKDNYNILPKLWYDEPPTTRKAPESYQVYEIPAGEASFVVKTKIRKPKNVQHVPDNQEQPYYAPVYNFSPENAYFNAYNRLGPNDGQNSDDSSYRDDPSDFDKYYENLYNNIGKPPHSALRKFKFNKKKPGAGKKATLNSPIKGTYKIKMPLVVKKPKFTDIYFNADDYLDMDYYFGRMDRPYASSRKNIIDVDNLHPLKTLPNSNEEAHVRNSIDKGIAKNCMSGVRQLLFRHQIFGYVPEITTVKTTTDDPYYRAQSSKNKESALLIVLPEPHNKLLRKGNTAINKSLRNIQKQSMQAISNHDDQIGILKKNSSNDNDISNVIPKAKRHAGMISVETIKTDKNTRKGKINKKQGGDKPYTIKEILRHAGYIYKPNEVGNNYKKLKTHDEKEVEKPKHENNEVKKPYMGTIREILSIGDARDAFIYLEKLLKTKVPVARRGGYNKEIKPYLGVLNDMIRMHDQSLEQYDWLGTTVDILSALEKLTVAIQTLLDGGTLHPSDTQLLKYIHYLYVTSKASLKPEKNYKNNAVNQLNDVELIKRAIKEVDDKTQRLKRKTYALPRNKNRKSEYLKAKGLINRVWLYIRGRPDKSTEKHKQQKDLEELQDFLDGVRASLYDLHNALKHIALVTKYNQQGWYQNLKQLYLNVPEKKRLLEVLIHLTAVRMFDLIEDSSMHNLEKSYLKHIERHQKDVQRTKDEMVFLMKVMSEIKELEE